MVEKTLRELESIVGITFTQEGGQDGESGQGDNSGNGGDGGGGGRGSGGRVETESVTSGAFGYRVLHLDTESVPSGAFGVGARYPKHDFIRVNNATSNHVPLSPVYHPIPLQVRGRKEEGRLYKPILVIISVPYHTTTGERKEGGRKVI
jgi:hypothetical protein